MVPYMVWVLLSYGVAGLIVHLLHNRQLRDKPNLCKQVHYILVAHNHEKQMEWYLRALLWYSCLRAQSLRVTILDEGSQDDTLAIIERMKYANGMDLTVIGTADIEDQHESIWYSNPEDGEQSKFIDLRIPQEAAKIPYVQV
ncbi:hypothetical protein [Paenibacillus lentus]|uniref:Glycosyltransferase n=1 Tax=Paenibacillus lentus TaxID=1338368 RepID=A0A3S8RSK3_9BACL|nr:hypothetical protein [Paenibacillus lentus]AZK45904.1 hypothetical protein EIM92_06550 [Paenibacillus lentus]